MPPKQRKQRKQRKKAGAGGEKSGGGGGSSAGDARFSHVEHDPRFARMPKQAQRLKVDARFKQMFTDDRFSAASSVDKRGRKVSASKKDDLKRFYDAESDSESGPAAEEPGLMGMRPEDLSESSSDEEEDARALAAITGEAEAEAEAEASDSESDVPVISLDREATPRLAVMNLDWQRVRAVDLLVLFQSFLKTGSIVRNVSVYPSEFGLERMAAEARFGPQGIYKAEPVVISAPGGAEQAGSEGGDGSAAEDGAESGDDNGSDDDDDDDVDDDDSSPFDPEKLRRYERERMKYYYAVVTCDSVETARRLYTEVDGTEFERSSNVLDLRFVPDEVEFEHTPRDEATEVPSNYEAPDYYTSALQLTNVKLTWDEPDPARQGLLQRNFAKDGFRESDMLVYMASDVSDSDGEGTDAAVSGSDSEADDGKVILKRRARSRYASLLSAIGRGGTEGGGGGGDDDEEAGGDGEDGGDGNIEIVFEPGLRDAGSDLLSSAEAKKKEGSETVWERYEEERKQKRRERRRQKAEAGSESEEGDEDEEEDQKKSKKKKEKKKAKKSKTKGSDEDDDGEDDNEGKKAAEMELLMLDGDGDGKKNQKSYSLRALELQQEIKKGRKISKKKRRKLEREQPGALQDDGFSVDLKDDRFRAVLERPEFHLDPTASAYKRTAGTEAIVEARQKRRGNMRQEEEKRVRKDKKRAREERDGAAAGAGRSLDALVASVKSKAKKARRR